MMLGRCSAWIDVTDKRPSKRPMMDQASRITNAFLGMTGFNLTGTGRAMNSI